MYIAFDTETTGVAYDSQVLSAYFIILDKDLNKIDDFNVNLKYPTYHVSAIALECNKIDLILHDKTAVTIQEASVSFNEFLTKNKSFEKLIPLGHNISFDIKMITRQLISEEKYNVFFNTLTVDTLTKARFLKKNKKLECTSLSLGNLCRYLNIQVNDDAFHDAKYDTLMTIELYKVLITIKL